MRRLEGRDHKPPLMAYVFPGTVSFVSQARDLAVAEGVYEQPVVVARGRGVAVGEVHHLLDELILSAAYGLYDLILGLEADEGRVGVLVRDAVNLGRGPT